MGAHHWQWILFWPPFSMADKWFIKNLVILSIYLKPSQSSHRRPLRKRFPALNRDDPLIRRRRRGKQLTMVVMFVGCLELVKIPISYFSYHRNPTGWKFFGRNPYSGEAVFNSNPSTPSGRTKKRLNIFFPFLTRAMANNDINCKPSQEEEGLELK